jgi:DNA mismatch repair protein MutS
MGDKAAMPRVESGPESAGAAAAVPEGATPMMAQFLEIKAANPDCLLFYRMGDFYEMFFADAEVASRALGIALTKRGRHQGEDIPMCGVPVHAADDYLQRLISLGHRVAVCEQLENPAEAKRRGSKAVVKRDVVRLVTPGTLTEDSLLDARAHNFLAALFRVPGETAPQDFALAALDISTGELLTALVPAADLASELNRLAPREILLGEDLSGDASLRRLIEIAGAAIAPIPRPHFNSLRGQQALTGLLGVATLDAFGDFTRGELAACGALLTYVEITQVGQRPLLRPPKRLDPGSVLLIDPATRGSLELLRSNQGVRQGSLLEAIDRTVTGPGARELAARLASPLTGVKSIVARLDAVAFLREDERLRAQLRSDLPSAPDLARALARLSLDRGSPRDLGAVRDALAAARALTARLQNASGALGLPQELNGIALRLSAVPDTIDEALGSALADELPVNKRDGNFIREGYSDDLDQQRELRDHSRQIVAGLQAVYAEKTGVKSLKVRHNNVLGFFVEITATNAAALTQPPHNADFIHRQTLANAMRFSTAELSDLEARITAAADRALAIEFDLFANLRDRVLAEREALADLASALAGLDCYAGLAELSVEQDYVRPEIEDDAYFIVEDARHPVVEQSLARQSGMAFIGNDCALDGSGEGIRILLVTGPNMGGKSTFLRQNALIVVLAQMGAFVPARSARIGIVDRLFSRVGAADDLARGRSTFMVEMVETAAILNQATERSFVLLDEIGRGTATFDGLSIAWATLEYLHEVNRARALFATHYHELTALADRLPHAGNATVEVKEWRDEIVFLYRVVTGAADRSYGLHVAKLAGLPPAVLQRAGEVLAELEQGESGGRIPASLDDLPLFRERLRPPPQVEDALRAALSELNPDAMTPIEALKALYRLQGLLRQSPGKP